MSFFKRTLFAATALAAITAPVSASASGFKRIASFPVFQNTDVDEDTAAEIIAVARNGRTLIYSDSEFGGVGFVDIRRPDAPEADGFIPLDGEPTSVAISGPFALVATNTSDSFTDVSGELLVIRLTNRRIIRTIPLGGQPDSISVSPDGRYAAIAIENERDEDLGDGFPPQAPAGELFVIDTRSNNPARWNTTTVPLTGLGIAFADDPEPEFVDINDNNIAVVTLQENNAVALVDLEAAFADPAGSVIDAFDLGAVDLAQIDTNENDLIELTSSLSGVAREPDAVTWIDEYTFATANEGDLEGGSRGFSIFNKDGTVLFDIGAVFDQVTVSLGHYPENRSENRGNEPEAVLFAEYGNDRLLFVGSERASAIAVFKLDDDNLPSLVQVLPTGVGPEGLLAIPRRDLFVVANEVDDRGDKIRSTVSVYEYESSIDYPLIQSTLGDESGTPIPWGALSALAINPQGGLLTVHDSFYRNTRIFSLDTDGVPATLDEKIVLNDANGLLAAEDPGLVEASGLVNLDAEGLAVGVDGGYWVASEGAGTVGSNSRPFEFANYLVHADDSGAITNVVALPAEVEALQVRFGFEGVAAVEENGAEVLYVAFQREWAGDPDDLVRIGRYETATGDWTFAYYPIETPTSPNGGWVGLSEISALGDGEFAVIERDNQAGPDARIKLITHFSVEGVTFRPQSEAPGFDILAKTVVRDLIDAGDLTAPGGLILEKIEGLAVTEGGGAWWVNDNDGVDDSNGETQLRLIEGLF